MSIKEKSALLRKGMRFGSSFPVIGLADYTAEPVKFRTIDAPKSEGGNRKTRRARAAGAKL
jgi:hypothetical protein